jgi:hypothetical protein
LPAQLPRPLLFPCSERLCWLHFTLLLLLLLLLLQCCRSFDVLPELHWRFGYPYFYLLSAGVVALALLLMVYMRLIKVRG